MKCKIPEISWHNRDPVLSVDIQLNSSGLPSSTICRLASGGTDAHVLIWYINRGENDKDIDLELAADLARHQRAVNTVRWSPNGELLASGDDESVIFIWKQKAEHEVVNIIDADGNEQDKEVWITYKVLRGHREDVYDLSWAPNSQFLVTGSVDNTAMLWDVHKGKSLAILDDHKSYVQGVAWDPCNQYIATLSTDRHLRIFDANTKRVLHRVAKTTLPVKEGHELYGKGIRLFHDGTLQTFFRRLCFTPDGKLLLTPAGITDYDGVLKPTNTTYGFSRYDLSRPAFVLPFPNEYTVAVRCSPVLYRLRPYNEEKNPPVISLPYRMIYAVATKKSVFFYDTQQPVPFAIVSNIHYTRLTDVTWSSDGNVLVVSSTDGFCSLLTFEKNELGERYEDMDAVLCAAAKTSENVPQTNRRSKKQKMRKASSDDVAARRPLQEKSKPNVIAIKHKPGEASLSDNKDNGDVDLDAENDSLTLSGSSAASDSPKPAARADAKPKPIAIRRKPAEPTKTVPTPIEIRRSPRKPKEEATITPKPTPIAIKRKASSEDVPKETTTTAKPTPIAKAGEKVATPIAIKRKASSEDVPKGPTTPVKPTPISKASDKVATPIAIKRKASSEDVPVPAPAKRLPTANALPRPIEIVIDKEIISSEEKFEAPEQKSRPATPIQVRRQPRTPGSSSTQTPKSQPAKHATPIAVRRTPRVLIEAAVNSPVAQEEAMDAWPLEEGIAPLSDANNEKSPVKKAPSTPLALNEMTSDRTEDMRLVYEDTQDETTTTPAKKAPVEAALASPKPSTPTRKTPRRVSLRTISTPKSKQKLLE